MIPDVARRKRGSRMAGDEGPLKAGFWRTHHDLPAMDSIGH